MARLCLACQTTVANRAEHCLNCGRNVREAERSWARGLSAWRDYLDATGWYPKRRDAWVEDQLSIRAPQGSDAPAIPRVSARYLGGHPALPRASRVVLLRQESAVIVTMVGWWPARAPRVVIPLNSIRSVSLQRSSENTPDDAVVTAALGGARTGPLGMAFGAAVARRWRVVRMVQVQIDVEGEAAELLFRSLDDHARGYGLLMRIFQRRGPDIWRFK